MRILVFHGYLLRGTGSNVYNASLAQAMVRLGHEVHQGLRQAGVVDVAARAAQQVAVEDEDPHGRLRPL